MGGWVEEVLQLTLMLGRSGTTENLLDCSISLSRFCSRSNPCGRTSILLLLTLVDEVVVGSVLVRVCEYLSVSLRTNRIMDKILT